MTTTSIEWVRDEHGGAGMSWNALRAVREIERKNKTVTVSAHHCEHVNEACRFCYADRMNARLGGLPFKPGHRKDYRFVVDEKKLLEPLRRRKPTRIFVESMSDAFGDWWPTSYIDKLYAVMELTPWHTYINLTKRPERRRKYLDDTALGVPGLDVCTRIAYEAAQLGFDVIPAELRNRWPLFNVIEGTSVSNQPEADEFVPILLRTKAAVRALSCEPLLGPIEIPAWLHPKDFHIVPQVLHKYVHWVIVGGESGPHARPMHPDWARSLRDQCEAAGVAFFFKQWGEWIPATRQHFYDGKALRLLSGDKAGERVYGARVGKKAAGRLLDGVEHNGFPVIAGTPRIKSAETTPAYCSK